MSAEAMILMGKGPDERLVPIRVDSLGRLEFVESASGDQDKPTQPITGTLTSAVTGTVTANPTRHSLLTKDLLAGTDTAFLIAAANYRDVIIYLMNVDTAARTVTIALAASITDTNVLCKTMPCEVGSRIPICLPALSTGQTLCGLCDSASKVAVEVWGIQV